MRKSEFVVCMDNTDYPASLERCKLYRTVPDEKAAKLGMLRIVDESGDEYVYPQSLFAPIAISKTLRHQLLPG